MSVTVALVLYWSVAASYHDVRDRRIPDVLVIGTTLALLIVAAFGYVWLSWPGAVIGLVLTSVARLPPGDRKAAAVLGALLGGPVTTLVCALALAGGLAAFLLYRVRLLPYPGEWAFFPFLAVPACVIVLTT